MLVRSPLAALRILAWGVALLLTALPVPSEGADRVELDLEGVDLHQMVPGAIEYYNSQAAEPISGLTNAQIESLSKGEVVVIRRKEGRADDPADIHHRVFGYLLIQQPILRVWLAGMHPDYMRNDTYIAERYSEDGTGGSVAYMYIRTPWPLADRQTVVAAETDIALTEHSEGWIWSQHWDIDPDEKRIAEELVGAGRVKGVDEGMMAGAVWLPANYGSFVLFRFADQLTLLGWSLTASVGGLIPDEIVAAFAASQLDESLHALGERAGWIQSVYVAEELPLYDGYGKLIPTQK